MILCHILETTFSTLLEVVSRLCQRTRTTATSCFRKTEGSFQEASPVCGVQGGGILVWAGTTVLNDCSFAGNTASSQEISIPTHLPIHTPRACTHTCAHARMQPVNHQRSRCRVAGLSDHFLRLWHTQRPDTIGVPHLLHRLSARSFTLLNPVFRRATTSTSAPAPLFARLGPLCSPTTSALLAPAPRHRPPLL